MKLTGMARTALTGMQPQRSYQIAWFVYGWIEREHFLNVIACADWWMRAVGLSVAQLKTPPQGIGNTATPVEPKVLVHDTDRTETTRHRSPSQVEPLS
jgi:hypothetical protein